MQGAELLRGERGVGMGVHMWVVERGGMDGW